MRTSDVLAVDVRQAGVDAKIAQNAATYEYLKDHLGSIIDIVDTAGNRLQHYVYSAFGMLIGIQDAYAHDIGDNPVLNTSFTFTGREYDSESGYYYYRARLYDAASGRFLQKDPSPGLLTLPVSVINSYVYGGNNPLNTRDPSGQSFWSSTFGKIVIGVVMAAAIALTAGAAATFVVAELAIQGALAGAIVGAAVGAAVGGLVGGTLNVLLGQGSFTQGFIKGAISGAIAGGVAGAFQGAANATASQSAASSGAGSSSSANPDGAMQSSRAAPSNTTAPASGSAGAGQTSAGGSGYTRVYECDCYNPETDDIVQGGGLEQRSGSIMNKTTGEPGVLKANKIQICPQGYVPMNLDVIDVLNY